MADRDEKSPEDCYYFLYSSCRKGDECVYRHSAESKANPVLCERWSQTKACTQECPLRHSYHHLKKKRTDDQCYWETQEGGCTKKFCEFRHRDPQKDAWRESGGRPADIQYKTADDAGRGWSDEKPKRRMWQDEGAAVEAHPTRGDYGLNSEGKTQLQNTTQLNGSRWFKNRNTAPEGAGLAWATPGQYSGHGDAPAPFQAHHTILDNGGADVNASTRGASSAGRNGHAVNVQRSQDRGAGTAGAGHAEPLRGKPRGSGRGAASKHTAGHAVHHESEFDEGALNEELRELDDLLHELD